MAKKELNLKAYGICAFAVVAIFLVFITTFTFKTKYNGFDEKKMAVNFVDTIVQTGDGYNACKNTLLSKNSKFGDFIRKNYINPEIYENYTPGADTKNLKGLNSDELKGEKTLNDDGTLKGQLIDAMYPIFKDLVVGNGGFDNYDVIFTEYIKALKIKRAEIFGDEYFNDEAFFTTFEANLLTYGESLTGTEDVIDEKSGVQIKFKSTGIYEEKFGKDYKITVEAVDEKDAEAPDLAAYGIEGKADDCKVVTVNVLVNGEVKVNGLEITLVKLGSTWYVANNACNTSVLYNFYNA